MLKKVLIGIAGLVGLLVVAILLIPLFIDANKFRPKIESAVEENLNADLQLGKLGLSLWGGVNIEVDKLVLTDKGGTAPVFSMSNAKLKIPYLSVLSGTPNITVVVQKPEINVISGADGKLNVTKLMKPGAAAPAPAETSSKGKAGAPPPLPFELSFDIEDGKFVYADQKKGTKTEIKGFDFWLKRFGLNREFVFGFKSNLDVKEMKELTLRGPVNLEGKAAVYVNMSGLERVEFGTEADMSGVLIRYGKLFDKAEKVPLKAGVTLSQTPNSLNLKKMHLLMGDAAVDVTGTVNNFEAPVVDINVASNKFVFENWQQAIGPLKEMDMKGVASFNVKVSGPQDKLAFQGKANASGISLQAPGLVQRVTDVKATIGFSNDTATLTNAGLKIGDSDLAMDGTIKNFSKPVINLNVKSSLLDVDAMLPKKTPEEKKAEAEAAKAEASGKPFDMEKTAKGPIAAMKRNPVARATDATFRMQVGKIKVNNADITNLNTEMTFKELVMSLKKATAQAFGGSMSFTSGIDFRGADPAYQAAGEVSGLDVNAAITSQMPTLKDTVLGKLQSKFAVSGSGLSKPKVKQSMKGSGNFRLEKGSWSALSVLKQIGDKAGAIPGAKEKLGNIIISGRFRQVKSDFNISGGRFNIVNMIADMEEANTTLTGAGFVDFDMNLAMSGDMMFPGNPPSGKLRSSDGRFKIPYEIGCQATAPCVKAEKTLQVVGGAYLEDEGKKAAKKALEKIDNPVVQDLLKKLPF